MDSKLSKKLMFGIFFILIASISFAVGFSMASTPVTGAVPVYSGSGDEWNPSGTTTSGITILRDQNTVCFPRGVANTCDVNIVWNGTNLIING